MTHKHTEEYIGSSQKGIREAVLALVDASPMYELEPVWTLISQRTSSKLILRKPCTDPKMAGYFIELTCTTIAGTFTSYVISAYVVDALGTAVSSVAETIGNSISTASSSYVTSHTTFSNSIAAMSWGGYITAISVRSLAVFEHTIPDGVNEAPVVSIIMCRESFAMLDVKSAFMNVSAKTPVSLSGLYHTPYYPIEIDTSKLPNTGASSPMAGSLFLPKGVLVDGVVTHVLQSIYFSTDDYVFDLSEGNGLKVAGAIADQIPYGDGMAIDGKLYTFIEAPFFKAPSGTGATPTSVPTDTCIGYLAVPYKDNI